MYHQPEPQCHCNNVVLAVCCRSARRISHSSTNIKNTRAAQKTTDAAFFTGPSYVTMAKPTSIRRIRVHTDRDSGSFPVWILDGSCRSGAQRTLCAGSSRRERRSAPRTKLRSSISGSRARILRPCHGLLALTYRVRLLRTAQPSNFLAWRSRRTSGVAA